MYKMKADGVVFYDPSSDDAALQVLSPKAKYELNKAGSLTFTLLPGNVMYDGLQKMKTIVTLEQDGEMIFRGRVLETTTDAYNQRSVYCEGELAYLLDSLVRPYQFEGKASDLFRQLVETHNEQVEDYKQFQVGIVSAVDDEDTTKTDSEAYTDTLAEIRQMLINPFDGYLRIRVENGVRYLDWIDEYDDECEQAIEFGVNLVDIENKLDAGDICTVLVPLGGVNSKYQNPITIAEVNGGKDYLEDAEAIAQYGRIVKTFKWEDITDPQEIMEEGLKQFEKMKEARTLTIKAVDLHIIDASVDSIRLGMKVKLLSSPHGLNEPDICSKIDLDVEKPENTEYTFGIPQESLTDKNASRVRQYESAMGDMHKWLWETEEGLFIAVENVNALGNRTTNLEISVDAVEEAITLKADKAEVDEVEQKVSNAEIRLDAAEAAIDLKADQTVTSAIEQRMSDAEIRIDGAEADIALKASQETVNAQGERLTTAEADIDGLNARILLMATKDEVTDVTTAISEVRVDLDAAEADIKLKANQSVVDDVSERVTVAEADIDGLNGQITLMATKQEVSTVSTTLSDVQADLDAAEAAILLKADKTVTDGLTTRMSNAEADIDAANAAIALKASQSTVDEHGELISTVQADLDAAEAAILLKASQSDMDAVFLRLDGAEDSITAQASTINLKADKTYVDNLVADRATITALNAVDAELSNLTGGLVTATVLSSNLFTGNQLDVTYANVDSLTHGGELVSQRNITMGDVSTVGKALSTGGALDLSHSHAVTVNADGTITLGEVATTGGTFKIADTAYYKEGVSAARTAGINSVTLSGAGWVGGSYAVNASNGNSFTVELPTFYTSGGTSFNSSHQTTVYFFTDSVSGPLKSAVVDASSVYDGGYDAGYADAFPASVSRVATYDSAANAYNVTAAVMSADGTSTSFDLVAIDASAAYDAGYAAGYQAAKDAVKLYSQITWSNPAQNYARVSVYINATVDGEEVESTTNTSSQNVSGYV